MAKKAKDIEKEPHLTEEELAERKDAATGEEMAENEHTQNTGQEGPDWEEKAKIAEDKYTRLFAEFDNYKKRAAKEKLELIQSAGKNILESLIPVVDDLERAMKNIRSSDDADAVKEGVELIHKKLYHKLEEFGLKAMESPIGKPLDTDFHEAITTIPAPDKKFVGKIIDEVEKGYLLKDRVLRFAKVVVGE
jgi:molecular chaperone GrpE